MVKVSNKQWFSLHGWCALPVWVLFCFICLTGTLAVLSHEITWLVNPDARAEPVSDESPMTVTEAITLVQQKYSSAQVTGAAVREAYLTYTVSFTDEGKPYALAYVNPYTGKIQEVNDGNTFINFMRSLHGWLLFPWQQGYSIGYYIVGAMGFFMLGSLITGLMVYKKFWRAFTQPTLRFSQGVKTALSDLHKLTGAWSIWFLLLMSVTGIWYLVQGILWHNEVEIEPWPHALEVTAIPSVGNQVSGPDNAVNLHDVLVMANQEFGGFSPSYVMLPEHNRDSIKVFGHHNSIFYDDSSLSLAVNPWTGDIINQYSPESMGTLQSLMHLADPLHYGTIGGLWTKLIWFVFGLLISGMSVTSFMMWRRRLTQASRLSRENTFDVKGKTPRPEVS